MKRAVTYAEKRAKRHAEAAADDASDMESDEGLAFYDNLIARLVIDRDAR